ncbi:class I SAM-dependent methyltransferase [Xanthomonas citri]|uniref:class I SAM-dependent methyltransferase n=1 Tax=Xanthomonas citri TaxID=346 RepID=UPI0021BD287B|nr:class I SAM-dependent methyltransferase [Xanthomonas citri]
MTHSVSPGNSSIADLVAALPEKYQPIFGHPEISDGSSRGCEDRLEVILDVVDHLRTALGRPIRVLDLGCAQGYFSLNLAARGPSSMVRIFSIATWRYAGRWRKSRALWPPPSNVPGSRTSSGAGGWQI